MSGEREARAWLALLCFTVPALATLLLCHGLVPPVVLLALQPVCFFDCMDGHPMQRCSLPQAALGPVRDGRQCGDIGW